MGFSGSSAGKESSYNAGDPDLIPGLGRFPGEGIGCPLQYSWASLVAQMVKNLPAMQETWVWSLAWKDPLEEGMATHSNFLAWTIPMDRGQRKSHGQRTLRAIVHGVATGHDWATKAQHCRVLFISDYRDFACLGGWPCLSFILFLFYFSFLYHILFSCFKNDLLILD